MITSLLAGLLLALSVPPWGWWPLAFVAFALLSRKLDEPSRRARGLRGAAFALGWFLPSVFWMVDFTLPGFIVVLLLWSAFWALAAIACPPGRWRWLALPAAAVLAELVRWSWPFGGQPLATVAMSQVDSPLGPTVRLLGPLLLVALVVAVGVALDALADGGRRLGGVVLLGVVAVVLLAGVAPDGAVTGHLDVALVQGAGRRTPGPPTPTSGRSSSATWPPVRRSTPPSTWSCGRRTSSTSRARSRRTAEGEELAALARELGDATLVVGAVEGDGDGFHNSAIAYEDGEIVDRFEKVRRVPFGEYVPLRGLLEPLAGDALPERDAIEGEGAAVLDTDVGHLGVVISWEVFFANRARDAISNGGEVLLNPTNGSSYWLTIVQTQQIASSRLRAMETGRWVLQVAPTGLTAIVTPDGEVIDRTSVSERAVVQGTIETRSGETIYTRWGDWPIALLAVAVLLLVRPRARSWWARRSRG